MAPPPLASPSAAERRGVIQPTPAVMYLTDL